MEFYKHYIIIDEHRRIIGGFSDAFHQPAETDICVNEKGGYQFRLVGIENPILFEFEYMIPLYKWENGKVVKRTEDEIAADIAAIPEVEPEPTIAERVTATEDSIAELENAMCEMDAANSEAIAAIENALCELDM